MMKKKSWCMCVFALGPVINKFLMYIVFYHLSLKNLSQIKYKGNKRLAG